MSWILGIETSGRAGSIALRHASGRTVERNLAEAGRRHAQTLVLQLDELFREVGIAPRDCTGAAVSRGPGSFTGLRVGLVCAKTFAYAVGCPLVAVDTFGAIAAQCDESESRVQVVDDAQQGQIHRATCARGPAGTWSLCGDLEVVPRDAWIASLRPEELASGPGVTLWEAELTGRCRLVPAERREPRAGTIALLGAQAVADGRRDDPFALEPLYVRASSAERAWTARGGR
jgi:tRNA threonylcarbamoyladenosine biosynthesis protein TsaB